MVSTLEEGVGKENGLSCMLGTYVDESFCVLKGGFLLDATHDLRLGIGGGVHCDCFLCSSLRKE